MSTSTTTITPTITTDDPHVYREQMELIASFSEGVHLDFSDGVFAPTRLLPISESWRTDELITHVHIMYKSPLKQVKKILKLGPDLAVFHAESENLSETIEQLNNEGVRTGVAILPDSSIDVIKPYIGTIEHVLVFGGNLGYQGGVADLSQLTKVREIKQKYPDIEISWDGGVNEENVKQIADAGVDIINVGGFIKNAEDPEKAYTLLSTLVS